ncbi:CoA transferase [Cupriavidus basilensis]
MLGGGRRPAQTADGWICVLPYTDRHWKAFFHAVGRDDLADKYNIASRAQRNAHIRALYQHLAEITPARTTAEWMTLFETLDIPATPIYTPDELLAHPHLEAVGLFQQTEHPTEGPLREMRPTARFSATPLSLRRHAPTLGEHTDEVLREAGLAPEDIAQVTGDSECRLTRHANH